MNDQAFYGISGAILITLGCFVMAHESLALTKPLLVMFRETYRGIRAARSLIGKAAGYMKDRRQGLNTKIAGVNKAAAFAAALAMTAVLIAFLARWALQKMGIAEPENYVIPLLLFGLLGFSAFMFYVVVGTALDIAGSVLGGITAVLDVFEAIHAGVQEGLHDFLSTTASLSDKQITLLLAWMGGGIVIFGTILAVRSFLP